MQQDTSGTVGETKPWYLSKTIIGAGISAGAVAAGFFGVTIDEATKQVILDQTSAVIGGVVILSGLAMTIVGRVTAKKAIGPAAK